MLDLHSLTFGFFCESRILFYESSIYIFCESSIIFANMFFYFRIFVFRNSIHQPMLFFENPRDFFCESIFFLRIQDTFCESRILFVSPGYSFLFANPGYFFCESTILHRTDPKQRPIVHEQAKIQNETNHATIIAPHV